MDEYKANYHTNHNLYSRFYFKMELGGIEVVEKLTHNRIARVKNTVVKSREYNKDVQRLSSYVISEVRTINESTGVHPNSIYEFIFDDVNFTWNRIKYLLEVK